MANDARAITGCRPYQQPYGNLRVQAIRITTGAAMYIYQPLTLDANGQVAVMTSAANTVFCGVAVGFLDINRAGLPSSVTTTTAAPTFPATGTLGYALVTTDPHQLYIMEEGSGGTAFTQSEAGCTVTFDEVSLGNTTTGVSDIVIQQSSLSTSTQGTFQLIQPADWVNFDGTMNSTGGSYTKWVVKPVRHQFGSGLGSGVPV